jgi:hypothetical protein
VESGELVPIRCVRVKTNVDLSRVRFNQVQYNRRDIEETIAVPARDRLIVQTYSDNVPGRKAVVFCVNVRHGEQVAERFRAQGVPARSVSGRMPSRERQEILADYARGELRVLCACDLLNEGWDCPDVGVLFMARPTLSRVIYLQQLGRGTRKAPGKDCLIVFDFVDNASRYNQELSLHRVLGTGRYRPGALVLATADQMRTEEAALARGEGPPHVLPVSLWARDYEEVDVFNWQAAVADMVSSSDLELQLGAAGGRVRSAVERGLLVPDHTLTLGDRTYYYFQKDRAEQIREQLGLPKISDENIRDLFLDYVKRMDMSSSYKPVMLRAILEHVDEAGRARLDDVVDSFHRFYLDRQAGGMVVERNAARMTRPAELSRDEVRELMLTMPFEKFERRQFLRYDKRDLAYIQFWPNLWRRLSADDLAAAGRACEEAIEAYYDASAGR